MNTGGFVFTDRYQAAGIPYPDPATVCPGQCEGMGCVPVTKDVEDPRLRALWHEANNKRSAHPGIEELRALAEGHELDPYIFVMCPDCNGTGKVAP